MTFLQKDGQIKSFFRYGLSVIFFYAPPVQLILLLLDSHSSHNCLGTVFLAAKEKVILFTLPPNTTHLTQPLDKGCFRSLKSSWRNACHDFMAENPGRVVTSRYSFCSVFAVACMAARKNIIVALKVAGIFPVDRRKLIHCDSPASSLLQNVDPAYIAMLTPTPHTKKIATSNPITFSNSEHKLYCERQQPKSTADSGEEKKSKYMLWKEMYFPYRLTSDYIYVTIM